MLVLQVSANIKAMQCNYVCDLKVQCGIRDQEYLASEVQTWVLGLQTFRKYTTALN